MCPNYDNSYICIAFVFYEFTFGFVCDVYDVISTLISGVCTYLIEFLIFDKKYRACFLNNQINFDMCQNVKDSAFTNCWECSD